MSALQFDASTVTPQGDRAPVPAGEYQVILSGSDVKENTDKSGRMLACTFKIVEGPIAGQTIFQNINYLHKNPVAQQIGQERLSALCHCVGVLKITDSAQLHGRPLRLKVSVTEDGKYNEINAFLKADGSPASSGSTPVAQSAPAWAQSSPAPQQAPAAAPVQHAAPVAMPMAPALATQSLYYVAFNGQNITPQPISADQVRALPQGLAAVQVCKVGEQSWQAGTTLAVSAPALTVLPAPAPAPQQAPAPAAQGGLPPWMTPPQ